MKKILFILFTTCLIVSCDNEPIPTFSQENNALLFTITFNGESHEFVRYVGPQLQNTTRGIAHWPGCKYCQMQKEKEDSINPPKKNINTCIH